MKLRGIGNVVLRLYSILRFTELSLAHCLICMKFKSRCGTCILNADKQSLNILLVSTISCLSCHDVTKVKC